ncbi:oligosaccharide flippase family protein [Rufibacter sp. XAAS-G3-1]|uniref:oligosaccharide flippase family protein n=1 Tax=Rufibacter sp. XAAS-G3-1 TaxID=2729134 RepID=UPI0015E63470|nr:oligosaccharide flippase family protein [Rufibacter sp. XAAS-G3-1]
MAGKQHMKQFLQGSIWSALSTVARAGSALVVNKLFAVYYGPSGIALLSHFQSLVALLTTLPNSGVNVGLVRHLAQGNVRDERYASFFWAGLWLNLITFVGVLGGIFIFPSFFLDRFDVNEVIQGNGGYVLLGVFLITLLLLHLFWLSVLLARQALRAYVFLSLLTSGCTITVMWWSVGNVTLPVVLFLFLAGQAISGVVGGVVVYCKAYLPKWHIELSKESFRELGKFVLMAVSTLVGGKLADFIVREVAISRFSLHDTGMWQAVVRISDSYTMVYTSILGMVYYPKVASLVTEEDELKRYIRTIFLTLVPLLGVSLLLVSGLREYLILLLFNKDFLPAQALFDYQLIGDFLKMVAWILSYVIAVRAQLKLYICIQLFFPLVCLLLVKALIPIYGIEGLPLAGAIGNGLYLVFHLYLFRSYLFYK